MPASTRSFSIMSIPQRSTFRPSLLNVSILQYNLATS
jgi:hypothetical protein